MKKFIALVVLILVLSISLFSSQCGYDIENITVGSIDPCLFGREVYILPLNSNVCVEGTKYARCVNYYGYKTKKKVFHDNADCNNIIVYIDTTILDDTYPYAASWEICE